MANEPTLPRSLSKVSACLEGFTPPVGSFDPHGAWEHRYAVWVLFPAQSGSVIQRAGALRLRREPSGRDAATLDVTLSTTMGGRVGSGYYVHARLTCATDRLATPRSWELKSCMLDAATGRAVDLTETQQTGQVAGGMIRRQTVGNALRGVPPSQAERNGTEAIPYLGGRGKVERTVPAPKALSSNWSLFDALQRLPGNNVEPLAFDMLEEMDLLKPNQRLAYRRSLELPLSDQKVKLHCFEHLGEGILPYEYWLDDQRRLLIAVSGMRAFIFDPTAQVAEVNP